MVKDPKKCADVIYGWSLRGGMVACRRERKEAHSRVARHVHKSRQLGAATECRNGQLAGDIRGLLELGGMVVNVHPY